METSQPIVTQHNHGLIQVVSNISINAKVARRLVNVQLMKKVGQMIITGEPEITVDGSKIYWKVPLFVVPPDGDDNIYQLKHSAFVDAISGIYIMEPDFVEKLKAESTPILQHRQRASGETLDNEPSAITTPIPSPTPFRVSESIPRPEKRKKNLRN